MQKLFVYGTLKKGKGNHDRILSGYDIKITPAWTYGKLYDLGWYPALTQGNNKVYGELIEFDDPEILMKIDWLEGFRRKDSPSNFYDRVKTTVFINSKTPVIAWIYLITSEKIQDIIYEPVSSGVWEGNKD